MAEEAYRALNRAEHNLNLFTNPRYNWKEALERLILDMSACGSFTSWCYSTRIRRYK